MKVALIGSGKTGIKVTEILNDSENEVTIFNVERPPTKENLEGHDVVICFVPGDIFLKHVPLLIESGIPVVSGATGFEWPEDIEKTLLNAKTKWIYGGNFSLGMTLVNQMIKQISKASILFDTYRFELSETHHTEKKDAPSGTALLWEKWVGEDIENIESKRVGDVVGIHELTLVTENEKITLNHEALDRKIFAQGAIWAAKKIISDKSLGFGLFQFEDIIKQELLK